MSQKQRLKKRVRQFDHPDLLAKCEAVDVTDDIDKIEADMRKVLKAHYEGVGLAANQIGYLVRAVLVGKTFMVNPEIMVLGTKHEVVSEGCLSYPGTFTKVSRPTHVRIKHEAGETEFHDFEAAIACHEIEHLDGECLVGRTWRMTQ